MELIIKLIFYNFLSIISSGAAVNKSEVNTIAFVSFDEEIDEKGTFTKMDIEGSEIDAING